MMLHLGRCKPGILLKRKNIGNDYQLGNFDNERNLILCITADNFKKKFMKNLLFKENL